MKNRTALFLTSFFASCLVLGGLLALVFLSGGNGDRFAAEGGTASAAPVSSSGYLARTEDAQNILIMGGETRGGEMDFFVLLKINPVRRQFLFTLLPPDTLATVNITTDTLAGHYAYGGCALAAEAVRNACHVQVTKYLRFSKDDLLALIDNAGGLPYTVPRTVGEVQAGYQLLDGRRVYTLLSDWEIAGKLVRALMDKLIRPKLVEDPDALFDWIAALPETDISAYDYRRRGESVVYTARGKKRTAYQPSSCTRTDAGLELDEKTLTALESRFFLK